MALTDIKQLLSRDNYNAIVGANAPSAGNVFATMADITGGGGDLATTLGLGDTGTAGQDINLVGGLYTTNNNGTPSGPTSTLAGIAIDSQIGSTTIRTTSSRPTLIHDLELFASTIGSYVKIQSTSTGAGLFKVIGNGEALVQFNLSGTNRTVQFQDASGTVAYTSDITGTNSGTNTGDQNSGTTFIISNDNTLRTIDVNAINGANLRDLVCTLIRDLNTAGILTV